MGNRAVITSVKKDLGVYVQWNGGPDSIGAFLDYCSLRGFLPPESDPLGYARLCQVLGNYFGPDGLSVGIEPYTTDEQMDPGDNGIYVTEGWAIVERIGGYDYGSEGYDHDEMLRDIDKSQPENQQLSAFLDADVVPAATENRAVITSVRKDLGVFVQWNGDPDIIGAFLDYCSLRGFRPPESDPLGYARLCQVLGNYFGADDLSVGISPYTTDERMDPGDNGIYVIEHWAVVERIGGYDPGSEGCDPDELLRDIDKSQPEDQQLGAFLDADVVPVSDLSVGDRVYMRNTRGNMVEHTVVGFGSEGSIVNGHRMDGVPYVDKYDHDGDYSWNSNNYLKGETVRRSYEAAAADGCDLESEGRTAREVSAGLGDRADRQPDLGGRDL